MIAGINSSANTTEDPGRIPLRFRIIAIGFALGAFVHFAAMVIPGFGVAVGVVAPVWRNALFTFIDAVLAWAALKRPPILAVAMPLIFLQQLSTKGVAAWQLAREGRFPWLHILVLGFILYSVIVVWRDRAQRKSGTTK